MAGPSIRTNIVEGELGWKQKGDCKDTDPNLFFPVGEKDPRIEEAKQICGECALRKICLDFALAHGEFGIWGGTTEEERRAMRGAGAVTIKKARGG